MPAERGHISMAKRFQVVPFPTAEIPPAFGRQVCIKELLYGCEITVVPLFLREAHVRDIQVVERRVALEQRFLLGHAGPLQRSAD
jgi:hypothetical protein